MTRTEITRVANSVGERVLTTRKRAAFKRVIGTRSFKFMVTDELSGAGQCITHSQSGKRVCAIGASAAYLPQYAKLASEAYAERAHMALDSLIARVGEARVAEVLAAAESQA